jgi:predicted thioredoxin/glutaredoxin
MLEIYVHPRCSKSYRVFCLLRSLPPGGQIAFLNVEKRPFYALERGVFSVPAFSLDGRIVLQGYFEDDEVKSLVEQGKVYVKDFEEAYVRLLKSMYHSFTVASAVYLAGDPSILANSASYLLSASGALFVPESERFLRYVASRLGPEVFPQIERDLLRNIAGNFARDLYWLFGETPTRGLAESLGEKYFYTWLLSRASIGRVFVPHSLKKPEVEVRVSKAWSYVLGVIDKVGERVVEEQQKIPADWLS